MEILELVNSVNQFLDAHWYTLFAGCVSGVVLLIAFHEARNHYLIHLNEKYIHGLKWKVFEIKFPMENLKSPKAMEQVFASLWGTYSFGLNNRQIWWDGEVEQWMSLDVVGRGHGVKFYIRFPAGAKNTVEAAFFAQYPEVELIEVPDYMESLPEEVPNETYDLVGTDLILGNKSDGYPLKTYEFFESPDEEKQLDPIATLVEAASGLKDDEILILQLIFRPTGNPTNPDWPKMAEKVINKITGAKEEKHGPGVLDEVGQFFGNIMTAAKGEEMTWGFEKEDKKQDFKVYGQHEMDLMKVVSEKMSKFVFDALIRLVYIDRKDAFSGKNFGAMMAALGQFGTGSFNFLKPNMATLTKGTKVGGHDSKGGKWPWNMFFRKKRLLARKKKLYEALRERSMPHAKHSFPKKIYTGVFHRFHHHDLLLYTSIMGTHELATIFHPPGHPVAAQKIQQLTSKKSGPPSSLPLVE